MKSQLLSSLVSIRMRAWALAVALVYFVWPQASGATERRYFRFSPFAGTAQFGSDDGFRTDARFQQPLGITQKADGSVFIADGVLATIRRVTTDGRVSVFAGESGRVGGVDGVGAAARFSSLRAVVADAQGNLVVADGSSIRRISPAGVVTTVAGRYLTEGQVDGVGEAARFRVPAGLAIDAAGNIWVADKFNHAIRRIDPTGVVVTIAGLSGEAGAVDGPVALSRFTYPEAIAIDRVGDVFVGDQTHTVRRIASGMVSTVAGKARELGSADGQGSSVRFFSIAGFAFGADGNLYVSDSGNRSIRRMTPQGVVTTVAGGRGYGAKDGRGAEAKFGGNFSGTQGLMVASNGDILVCDSPNGTIRAIAADGTVSTWAGVSWLTHDGAGTSARFSGSGAIAADADGSSYLADREAHAVRRIDSTGRVSTIAGGYGESGYRDGLALEARFNRPSGIAVAPDGTIFIADTFNQVIRRIKGGLVTTVAGRAGASGTADGRPADARFFQPEAILIDADGGLYVADTFNHAIRRLSSDGIVSTVAGQSGESGFLDGVGSQARFNLPCALAFAKNGDLLVADMNNCSVRVVTRQGRVATLVGRPDFLGRDGDFQTARIGTPTSLAVDDAGIIYVADALRGALREILPDGRVVTVEQTFTPHKIALDTNGRLLVSSGNRDVLVGVTAHSRLANLSIRAVAESQGSPLIAGFFVAGESAPADLLIRAIGPGLREFGVTAVAENPRLRVLDSAGREVGSNDDWGGGSAVRAAANRLGAFPLDPASTDAALLGRFNGGSYTAHVEPGRIGGVVLVEVYDGGASDSPARLANLSVRTRVVGGDGLIVGFAIVGDAPRNVLIRGIGPGLAPFGIAGGELLRDPILTVRQGNTVLATNEDWWTDEPEALQLAFRTVGAFDLPKGSDDSALLLQLNPGVYTTQIRGLDTVGGTVLVEIYEVP